MAGIERGTHPDLCNAKEWLKRTERALTDAKKDNDFIYHERIPDEKSLKSVAKAAVAKITPMPAKLGTSDKILFDSLVPLAVHQALAAYELRKNDIVNREINNRLKEATNLINASMSSMNLPAALEDTSGNEIPQSLREKSQAVISAGGPNAIKQLIDELPELLTRNTEILDECERLLREELASDEQLKVRPAQGIFFTQNTDSQFSRKLKKRRFFSNFFHENAERSVALGEYR
jgi:programmed cell death 6-interacting protein